MAIWRRWRSPYLFFIPLLLVLPLLLTVSDLHRRTISQTPRRNPSKKSDHIVLGPAAGQGMPDRLQCQGLKAMNGIHSSNTNRESNNCDTVTFVTVFTVYNSHLKTESAKVDDKSLGTVTVGNTSYTKTERSMAVLNIFVNFIQVSMPRSNVIILTDPASEFSVEKNVATILAIHGDYSRDNLMLQRIRSYITFLEQKLEEHPERLKCVNHYIFTDSDIAVVDNLAHIFQEYPNFHLALTFRNNKDQPLNSGFIAIRGTVEGILRAKTFLQEVLEVYSTKYMKASRMLGDQLALAWVVKSHLSFAFKKFSRHEAFPGDMNGTSVLFLPCAIYNWTPPEGAGQFHGMPLDVKVVHFKGSRKRLMLESWNLFNSTSNLSDMLCLILASGRTKYDF
ncbi:uncharacterized protein LOC120280174 isoform X1 [Dioscorea cayenensis subsp. rotundata]|uniref:Uncharacterized protein LOC120280174 isoform X1 n=1 Tax=Dioscorea cayennensis subsp. rotundata TaxID=55577 RepID=A0AB40CU01_DIOCR|nr:uncharacterized protein LOC120280174 isoform X1 [Dioscorea cayenensis subsp. rotundata]